MIDIPAALSPLGNNIEGILAAGPFIVERADPGGTLYEIGWDLSHVDAESVQWLSFLSHWVTPSAEPVVSGNTISFEQVQDGAKFLIRPLEPGDGFLAGVDDTAFVPANPQEAQQSTLALAEVIRSQILGAEPQTSVAGENNLYVTRDSSGQPLALIKMSASFPTLVRQNSAWRPLQDSEDDLLGAVDTPVRAGAVLAWDAGNLRSLDSWVSDDRFSPNDAIRLWVELDSDNHVQHLFLQRSQNRFYSRVNGRWVKAIPDPNAATVDVAWSAISAWDDGDLMQLAQVEPYDVDGEQAA